MMKNLFFNLVFATVAISGTNDLTTFAFNYPTTELDGTVFKLYSSSNILTPKQNWQVFTSFTGQTSVTFTDYLSSPLFLYLTASNYWGELSITNYNSSAINTFTKSNRTLNVSWACPSNPAPDLVFNIYTTTNLAANWSMITNCPIFSVNGCKSNINIQVKPGRFYLSVTASTANGESPFINPIFFPDLPRGDMVLKIFYTNTTPIIEPVNADFAINYISSKTNNAGATTHSLTNVSVGSLLVLTTQNETDNGNAAVSSNPSLVWTKRAKATALRSGNAEIYTTVTTNTGNITVTSLWVGKHQSSVLYSISGQETNLGGSVATNILQLSPSLNITTSTNSILIVVNSDFIPISGTITYRDLPIVKSLDYFSSGFTRGTHWYKTNCSAGLHMVGQTFPTNQSSGICAIEIRQNTNSIVELPPLPVN